jgi:hypothetical protein
MVIPVVVALGNLSRLFVHNVAQRIQFLLSREGINLYFAEIVFEQNQESNSFVW